jgi:hypothetical protein
MYQGVRKLFFSLQDSLSASGWGGLVELREPVVFHQIEACVVSGGADSALYLDTLDARSLGVDGTPTFFVNGRRVQGSVPAAVFVLAMKREGVLAAWTRELKTFYVKEFEK